jgi:Ser/Thr protein kinase RdoA (MazF antagonist)
MGLHRAGRARFRADFVNPVAVGAAAEETRAVHEPELLDAVLRAFGIRNAQVTALEVHGSTSISLAAVDDVELMVKRSPAVAGTRTKLIEQAELTRQLAERGVPVAVPMAALDGQPVVVLGDAAFTVSPRLVRRAPGLPACPETWSRVGGQLATLHIALDRCEAPARGWTMDLPRQLTEEIWPALDAAADGIGPLMPTPADRVELADRVNGLPTQRLHGDLHGGNILLDGDGVYAVLDFDEIPIGPRVSDIGYYAADLVKNRADLVGDVVAIIHEVVAGYHHMAVLSGREAEALVPLMIVSELRLLWWLLPRTSDDGGQVGLHLDTLGWILRHRDELDAVVRSATATAGRTR